MQLVVGQTYRRAAGDTIFKIVKQWNANLFEAVVPGLENSEKTRWMFSSGGIALGYPGHRGPALGWHLRDNPRYQTKLLFNDGTISFSWEELDWSSLWDKGTMYIVREEGEHSTSKLMTRDEVEALLEKK